LIIEDNIEIQKIIGIYLKPINVNKIFATTAEEAIEILNSDNIHLILSDIVLPQMSGKKLCRYVKQNKKYAETPIVAISSDYIIDDKDELQEIGFTDVLTKPFTYTQLLEKVKKYI